MTAGAVSAPRAAAPGLLAEIGRFGRFSVVGFTLLLTLAGAATASAAVTPLQLAALLAAGLAFHLFAYVSNDVFDLELDRTAPLRSGSPLVRGLLRPSAALAIALVPVPLVCALHLAAGGPPAAAAALLAAMGLMLLYNRFGKRLALPLLSDAVQALGWASLALYGALSVGPITAPFAWLAASAIVYVLMVNGLHGGLRDLANDALHGARTTALFLGARASADGRLLLPRAVRLYALALHLALLFLGWMSAPRWQVAVLFLHGVLLFIGRAALRAGAAHAEVMRLGFLHLYLSMAAVLLPFALFGDARTAAVMLAVYAAPLLVLAVKRMRVLVCLLLLAGIAGAEPVRDVSREEIARAMLAEKQQGYDVTASPNGMRFNGGVILRLARAAHAADPNGPPLFLGHANYFQAYLDATGLSAERAPAFIAIAHRFTEDQLVDYRRSKVIARVVKGREPLFAVNVVAGWSGGASRYSYEDHHSDPALRVTHERVTSFRLLDFGDLQLIDEVQGVSGRALTGLLGLVFRIIGDARAVRSFSTVADDGALITLTTGRKGFSVTTPAIVHPNGKAEQDIPPKYAPLARRLRDAGFEARYAALEKKSPAERRR
jgi:4-hydroxybenzoate polyprenyltransferase